MINTVLTLIHSSEIIQKKFYFYEWYIVKVFWICWMILMFPHSHAPGKQVMIRCRSCLYSPKMVFNGSSCKVNWVTKVKLTPSVRYLISLKCVCQNKSLLFIMRSKSVSMFVASRRKLASMLWSLKTLICLDRSSSNLCCLYYTNLSLNWASSYVINSRTLL